MQIEESVESIPLDLIISFGKDDYLTTFDTKETSHAQMIQKAEFNFYLYEKKVDNAEKNLFQINYQLKAINCKNISTKQISLHLKISQKLLIWLN